MSTKIKARGLCTRHYARWRKYGDPTAGGRDRVRLASGTRFGRLTVVNINPTRYREGSRVYDCICDCGTPVSVVSSRLIGGQTKSCGCLRTELHTKHGMSGKHPLYSTWCNIRQRCLSPTHAAYLHYGGRGITIDPRWDDFAQFANDMGERPEGASIDRIDNDGPYSPENCRWATHYEQGQNRRLTLSLSQTQRQKLYNVLMNQGQGDPDLTALIPQLDKGK